MDKALRAYLAELIGTFFLVFLCAAAVCAAVVSPPQGEPTVGLVGVAVAQGCVLAVLLTATLRVSEGCLNPAVTLMLWVTKRFEGPRMVALIVMQLVGAALAGGLIVVLFDATLLKDAHAGTPYLKAFRPTPDGVVPVSGLAAGVAIEAALTFLLTLALFASAFDPRRTRFGGLVAGLALMAGVLIAYPFTGAALNPARWFGTAIWQRSVPGLQGTHLFADHPIYWMGPILGALLAGIVYTGVIVPPQESNQP